MKEEKKVSATKLLKKKISSEPRNCKVSNWGQWSDCNKSCGIGESWHLMIEIYDSHIYSIFLFHKSMILYTVNSSQQRFAHVHVNSFQQWQNLFHQQTCSGEAERRREVLQRPAHGGRIFTFLFHVAISFILSIILSGLPCPALVDYKWCGSARNCKTGYFNWWPRLSWDSRTMRR